MPDYQAGVEKGALGVAKNDSWVPTYEKNRQSREVFCSAGLKTRWSKPLEVELERKLDFSRVVRSVDETRD